MSVFRCAGCRDYFPRPEYRRTGLGSVCSAGCAQLAGTRHRAKPPTHQTQKTPTAPATKRRAQDIQPQVRVQVSMRDRGRCRYCGRRAGHLHHIAYRSQGGSHEAHNLVTLCPLHHQLVHSNKGYWQPLLRAYIWETYVNGRAVFLPEIERRYG